MKRLILLFAVLLQTSLIFGQNYRNTAELFIEIPERGNYGVSVDNEFISSSRNRFRFFELGSFPTIVITKDNIEIFRKQIRLQSGTRLIASFSNRSGWRPINTLQIFERNQYVLDNWNGKNNDSGIRYDNSLSAQEFSQLLEIINREPFPGNKMSITKTALKNSLITTDQAIVLIKLFDFDDKKMEIAKYAYEFVIDKKNYFRAAEVFTFKSSKDELLNSINNWNGKNESPGNVYNESMNAQEFSQLLGVINREPFPENKVNIIKTALKGSMITTDQLITLTKVFDFDDKKMVIAKYAYDNVLDKKNYFRVAEVFTFNSSKDDLLNFINKK